MILEEVLVGITAEELASLIATFMNIYEEKFGVIPGTEEEAPEKELMHTNEASDYLKKFRL